MAIVTAQRSAARVAIEWIAGPSQTIDRIVTLSALWFEEKQMSGMVDHRSFSRVSLALAGSMLWVATAAAGSVQGLFIGVDQYPVQPLPNCVNDAKDMAALVAANAPGARITTLFDQQVTRQTVLDALRDLATCSGPDSETHVYYSGHGSRVRDDDRDEEDGADETWVMSDLDEILDDELGEALSKIQGKVIVISDSCHSGTVTKELFLDRDSDPVVAKRIGDEVRLAKVKYIHPDELEEARRRMGKPQTPRARNIVLAPQQAARNAQGGSLDFDSSIVQSGERVWLFSACSANESANPSPQRNSVFTHFFLEGIVISRNQPRTFGWMRQFIHDQLLNVALATPQTPALFGVSPDQVLPSAYWSETPAQTATASGTSDRFGKPSQIARDQLCAVLDGLVKRELNGTGAADWIDRFTTKEGRDTFTLGENVTLRVDFAKSAPASAYVTIFSIGPTGDAALLYPNFFQRENRLGALFPDSAVGSSQSRTLLVGDHDEVGLRFEDVAGEETVVAFLTDWNPMSGVDWDRIGSSNQVFLAVDGKTKAITKEATRLLRAPREKTLALGAPRPRENHARTLLILKSVAKN